MKRRTLLKYAATLPLATIPSILAAQNDKNNSLTPKKNSKMKIQRLACTLHQQNIYFSTRKERQRL